MVAYRVVIRKRHIGADLDHRDERREFFAFLLDFNRAACFLRGLSGRGLGIDGGVGQRLSGGVRDLHRYRRSACERTRQSQSRNGQDAWNKRVTWHWRTPSVVYES